MERIFAATEDGYYFLPKEASGNPLLNKKIEAMVPTVKTAPGNHHEEITGDPLPEHRVGAVPAPPVPPDYETSSWEPNKPARQPMQDDAGATTGLRRRPDYGESDSHTSELNRANSKGASAQYVIALAARSRKEASKTATMYVTGIEWDGLKVASFKFGSDVSKAVRLPNLTAKAVSQQLFAPPFEVKARPVSTASIS
jgi:hypothetical protein